MHFPRQLRVEASRNAGVNSSCGAGFLSPRLGRGPLCARRLQGFVVVSKMCAPGPPFAEHGGPAPPPLFDFPTVYGLEVDGAELNLLIRRWSLRGRALDQCHQRGSFAVPPHLWGAGHPHGPGSSTSRAFACCPTSFAQAPLPRIALSQLGGGSTTWGVEQHARVRLRHMGQQNSARGPDERHMMRAAHIAAGRTLLR